MSLTELPLHKAARLNDLDKVKFLIEKNGADLNKVNSSGRTPFHVAIASDSLDIINYLLQIRDQVNITAKTKRARPHL